MLDFYGFLAQEVKPQAGILEADTKALTAILYRMAKFNAFGIDVAKKLGGLELDLTSRHAFVSNITRASGALTLLETQHQTALKSLAQSDNIQLQEQYLLPSLRGEIYIGIGYSHLRETEHPPVKGVLKNKYYEVSGDVRFATGYKIFQFIELGFVNENNEEVVALIPFQKTSAKSRQLIFSKPLDLPAGKSTRTVAFKINKLKIPHENIISINPIGAFRERSLTRHNAESFHAGTALAILDLIASSPKINQSLIKIHHEKFVKEIKNYDKQVITRSKENPVAPVRAAGILLVNRCLLFAEQIFRGMAVNQQHPLFRLRNEAMLFGAIGADDAIMQEILKKI